MSTRLAEPARRGRRSLTGVSTLAGLALVGALSTSCAASAPAPARARAEHATCSSTATLISETPAVLEVVTHCTGRRFTGFAAAEEEAAPHIVGVVDAFERPLARHGERFALAQPSDDVRVSYRVDLDAVARDADSFDVAVRRGSTLVAPVSTWLLHPTPLYTDVSVELSVETPKGVDFTTGLERSGSHWKLQAHEIPVATYAVLGRFAAFRSALPGQDPRGANAVLDVAIADGKLDATRDELSTWVRDSAAEVARFWGGFPVSRVLVTLIPVPGRTGVVFGKVLPESAPGVVILVGEHTRREQLYQDWILVHELFHLGVPSFSGEGKWFDEGLATYFEPIIRARAGWRSEESVWAEFGRAMPLGLDALQKSGLENAQSFAEVYWGGAIVALLADVEIRRASSGQRGLEDGLRAVLRAGGHASEVWPLDRALRVSDKGCGVSALEPLTRRHSHSRKRVDLDAVFRELGVLRRTDGVSLTEDAPLASLRRRIVFGPDPAPSASPAARRP